jgi:hypothetical protein
MTLERLSPARRVRVMKVRVKAMVFSTERRGKAQEG